MVALKVFTQPACPRCPAAKTLGEKLETAGVRVEYYDVSNVDGLAESHMYTIKATPSLVLVNEDEDEVAAWRGDVPSLEEVQTAIKNVSVD